VLSVRQYTADYSGRGSSSVYRALFVLSPHAVLWEPCGKIALPPQGLDDSEQEYPAHRRLGQQLANENAVFQ